MSDVALALSAGLMGLAGSAHCAAMCAPACAALTGGRVVRPGASTTASHAPEAAFHAARVLGYATAGAVVAASVGALSGLAESAAVLRPLWLMLHMAALVLGVWLMITARQPGWMERVGRQRAPQVDSLVSTSAGADAAGWQRLHRPRRLGSATSAAGAAGGAWVLWPCGLLHSALVVAALANHPLGGAVIMASFGLTSSLGLVAVPRLWHVLRRRGALTPQGQRRMLAWAVRAAGALLVAASSWAAFHDVWVRVLDACFG